MRRRLRRASIGALALVLLVPALARAAGSEGAPAGHSIADVALLLTLVLVAAKVGGEIASRLKQPPVLGELLGGILLGNLPWAGFGELRAEPSLDILSQMGALILLFEVGLESTVRDVLEVGAAAVRVALIGTIASFGVGWLVAQLLLPDSGLGVHFFLGAAITATSIGITARVFKDLGQMRTREARTILGAAMVDDVVGLVVLALMSGWLTGRAGGSGTSLVDLLAILGKTIGFLAAALVVGVRVTPRLFSAAARMRTSGALLALGLGFCFFLSWAADGMGLAPIVGAFAAGLILEDLHSATFVARGERSLGELLQPISAFLVPIFFVVMGLRADIRVLIQPQTLALAGALTVAAVLGKLACALGTGRGVNRLAVAVGMVPRGEVTLVFASLGVTLTWDGSPILDGRAYSALVGVVLLTALITPLLLKWSFGSGAGLTRLRARLKLRRPGVAA